VNEYPRAGGSAGNSRRREPGVNQRHKNRFRAPRGAQPPSPLVEEAVRYISLSLMFLAVAGCAGEWKPTGDGKTVVNTRTGEIRVTSTGESVKDFNARVAIEKARDKERRAAAALESAKAAEVERLGSSEENGRHYHEIQLSVCSTAPSELSEDYDTWWFAAKPFRLDRFPTRSETDELVKVVERLSSRRTGPADKWSAVSGHLRSLRFNYYGNGEMIRTPDQIRESADARRTVDDRDSEHVATLEKNHSVERAAGEVAFEKNRDSQRQYNSKWLTLKRGLSEIYPNVVDGM
jgi:hypothetical protein